MEEVEADAARLAERLLRPRAEPLHLREEQPPEAELVEVEVEAGAEVARLPDPPSLRNTQPKPRTCRALPLTAPPPTACRPDSRPS